MVVQLEMPEGLKLKEKQLGLMYGVYQGSRDAAVQKGYGKCHLIKSEYHYFAIGHNSSGRPLEKGDLLYTFLPPNKNVYYGKLSALASHFIRLTDVHGNPFYDRYHIFLKWTPEEENKLIDSMVADIRFTGSYFLDNDPSMNQPIRSGPYQGSEILEFMAECQPKTVKDFFDFVNAKPRLYAGREWKVSEIFATWLKEGSPMVIRE